MRTDQRVVDFRRNRDGTYETFETDPDTGRVISSIVGGDNVIQLGEQTVVIDLGNNSSKQAVIEEAERAMGIRDLDQERLDVVEAALSQTLEERQL